MAKKNVLVTFLILFLLSTTIKPTLAQTSETASSEVSVSIGDYEFLLFGYSSPSSLITLEGVGIFDQTYSNSKGYFEFHNRFSPFSTREPCLYSQDQLGRTSHTLCIPPFPRDRSVKIGPVLLPPTVHLNRGEYFSGDQIILSGQTVPNTDVNLSFFIDQNRPSRFSMIKGAYAVSLPKVITKSDAQGNYSISLPSSQTDYYRVFVQDVFQKQDSPRSTTLSVEVLPWWMLIISFFLLLWDLVRSRFLELFILLQISAFIYYFFKTYLRPHAIARNKALALRDGYSLLVTDHEISLRDQ